MTNSSIYLAASDYAIVVFYFVITISLGLHFSRRWKGSEDFFLAGRSLTWPLIGLSLFATNISTEHFVGLAAGGNREGLVQGGYEWIASYCLLMLAGVFAPQYLKHKVFTIPEFFEKRYGLEVRVLLSLYFLAMIVLTKASILLIPGDFHPNRCHSAPTRKKANYYLSCRQYLWRLRWPEGFRCPRCQGEQAWAMHRAQALMHKILGSQESSAYP